MFSYLISFVIVFIILGVVRNILAKVEPDWWIEADLDEPEWSWFLVFIISLLWFLAIPVGAVCLIIYLLKLLTDKIADIIMKSQEKRKIKKRELKKLNETKLEKEDV